MTQPIEGPDRYVYAFDVTSDDNEFELIEGGNIRNASLDTGRYWGYKDNGNGPSALNSFLTELENSLNSAAVSNSYTVSSNTPPNSSLAESGIVIEATNSTPFDFRIRWGALANPINPRWIGWPQSQPSTSESTASSPADSVESPHSIYGSWRPITSFSDNTATQKPLDEERWLEVSSDDEINNTQVEYGDPIRKRTFMYPYAPAACVRKSRARDADYASQAGLPNGDTNNALYYLWQAASLDGNKEKIAILHNAGDTSGHSLDTTFYDYEVGFLSPKSARSAFSEAYDIEKVTGELYNLELTFALTTSEVSF